MACDLHTHSVFSDGTESPAQLIARAETLGLSALALCDHNTVDGLPEFIKAGEDARVRVVPGIEFSTEYAGKELHILALFVLPQYFAAVAELVKQPLLRKEASNRQLVERLCQAGYHIDYDAIKATTPGGFVNRAHIASALRDKCYVNSNEEAFQTLLRPGGGFYTPPKRLGAFEVLEFIRSIHAVSVLAHPFLSLTEPELRIFLEEAAPFGLDGMETVYTEFDARQTALAQELACEFGLLPSGGSDYHGGKKPAVFMGTGRGALVVPDEFFENLSALAAKRQKNEVGA